MLGLLHLTLATKIVKLAAPILPTPPPPLTPVPPPTGTPVDLAVWATLLLGGMGIVITGLDIAQWTTSKKDTKKSILDYLKYVLTFEVPPIGYKSTADYLHSHDNDAEKATDEMINLLQSSQKTLVMNPLKWNMWREMCGGIARGEVNFETSEIGGSAGVIDTKAIFDAYYDNWDAFMSQVTNPNAPNHTACVRRYTTLEFMSYLASQGYKITAYRAIPSEAYCKGQFRVYGSMLEPVFAVPLDMDTYNNPKRTNTFTGKYGTGYYATPTKSHDMTLRLSIWQLLNRMFYGFEEPCSMYWLNTEAVRYDEAESYADFIAKARQIKLETTALEGYIGQTQVANDEVGRYETDSAVPLYVQNTHDFYVVADGQPVTIDARLENGGFEGGKIYTAKPIGGAYTGMHLPNRQDNLGDIITPGRVHVGGNVIDGSISVNGTSEWADNYANVSQGIGSLADALNQAGINSALQEQNKVIEGVTNDVGERVDEIVDITIPEKIEDVNKNPTPPTPPIIPPPVLGISSGMITLFNPTMAELADLNDVLWSEDLFTNLYKMIANPMDGIITLLAVPIQPPTSGRSNVMFGNFNSGISMKKISHQFGSYSCGSIVLSEAYKSFLDYSPYTQVQLYLPFIGFVPLNTNEVIGAAVGVNYNIDYLSGACMAQVTVSKGSLNNVCYQYAGNMGMQLPITGSNYSRLYSTLVSSAGIVAGASAGGLGSMALAGAGAAVNVAQSAGGDIQRSGTIAGNAGFLGEYTPYIIVTRPRTNTPSNYGDVDGYLVNQIAKIGDMSGYVRVREIHLSGINATDKELAEIESLLKSGVEV